MTQAHTTGQERALREAIERLECWHRDGDLPDSCREDIHFTICAIDGALPHQPATDEGEALGEALFKLSARLNETGWLADNANHAAYEAVVAAFNASQVPSPAAETRLREALEEARRGFEAVQVLLGALTGREGPSIMVETFIERIDAALTQPEPTAQQGGEEERAAELIRSYFAARQARNDCPECGNEGPWEHCGPCSDRIGPVIARMSNFAINMDIHGEMAEGADKRDAVARIISLAKGAPENGQTSVGAWWWDKRHDRARPEHFEGECRDEDRKHADLMIPLLRATLSAQQAAGEAVAWLYQPWEDADVWLCQIVEPSQCHAKKPLYAAPQPEAPAEGEAK